MAGGLGGPARNGRTRARHLPNATASWYDGVGHVPHPEESERFNQELAELTRNARA